MKRAILALIGFVVKMIVNGMSGDRNASTRIDTILKS